MGLRGRAPKPTALLKLQGVTKPSRLFPDQPLPKISPVDPPVDLTPQQRLVWDSLAPELIRVGTLTLVDIPAFIRYIDLTIEYNEMQRQIAGENYFIIYRQDDGTPKFVSVLPQVSIRDRALANLLKLEAQFGMTPSSRTRVVALINGANGIDLNDPLGLDD